MRTREVLSSMGAGGSLIAAGVVSLLLFSSLMAFRAWPEGTPVRPDGNYALRAPAGKADGRVAAGPVVSVTVAAAPAARRREAGDRTRVRDRARRRRTASPRGGAGAPPSAPAAAAPVAAGASPSAAAEPAPATRPDRDPVVVTPPSIPTVPGPVQTVTDTGRNVVEQVTEALPVPLPPAVREPVGTLLDTAGGTAQAVDQTLGPLLP
jgi:hypothetical protein